MQCELIEKLPSAEEYNQLRESVGWGTYERDVVDHSLPNSLYCVCAMADGNIVGMARIVGDGGLVYYIQDVIVLPEYQGQGLGTKMMDRIMAYIRARAVKHAVIGLMASTGKEPFYEAYGFVRRPNGAGGMQMPWPPEPQISAD